METQGPTKLDAGALFVLQSKGSWLHCGYHLSTSIVAPALLSLPLAFASLGWGAGIACLSLAAIITFYSYNLLSLVLEHYAQQGHRLLRFRDIASHVLGPRWGRYYIGPIQFMVCFGAVIGNILLGGQSMKTIYIISQPHGTMKLYEFIVLFGVFMLIMAQIPSFHSLRYVNLISLALCIGYSSFATAGSIQQGQKNTTPKDYSLQGSSEDKIFGAFNAIAIIATSYGNGIIPEIQATIESPVKGKMFKGLCLCYTVVITTFFAVAISGYWAFGNKAQGVILSNFFVDGKPTLSDWFLIVVYTFTLLQLSAVAVVYLQPTNESLEGLFADPNKEQYSIRNVVPRLLFRSLSVAVATTIAAMLPFFGDINGVIGAFGFLPLDFVIPAILYNITFKPSRKSLLFWLNTTIAITFSCFSIIGSISAVRQIALDATDYKLFANV
ncbi:putative Amino acid transporter [Zostera marina]|uniref:Putative Amino acid transporter n=1 Tax=Zostera marina TaxID=29655 RepID=A0A0K9P5U0_ZOSMR|nr:putative Amino acid transporter [Zostera marina]